MRQKKTIFIITMLIFFVGLLSGCGNEGKRETLKLEEGILSWEKDAKAAYYEVDMGAGKIVVNDTSYALANECKYTGDFVVAVSSVSKDGEKEEIGSMQLTSISLAKPNISVREVDGEPYFVWKAVEGSSGYTYDAQDGTGIQEIKENNKDEYFVKVTQSAKQTIKVTAKGSSDGKQLFIASESYYNYSTPYCFDMSMLAQYPVVFTGKGDVEDEIDVGTNLTKGVYELELSLYIMDPHGYNVTGNGVWGRRVVGLNNQLIWFCEKPLKNYPESEGTIPNSYETVTVKVKLAVNRCGNITVPLYDFLKGEMVVFADIVYNGKSVINANGGIPNEEAKVKKFDVSTVDKYLACYKAPGKSYSKEQAELFALKVPLKVADGTYDVAVTYYVCTATGDMISGNGTWGRRITGTDPEKGPMTWLNEYDVAERYKGVKVPLPTEEVTSKLSAEVKNGVCQLNALDFGAGEFIIVKDIKVGKTPNGNGVYVCTGNAIDQLDVETTLGGEKRLTDVTLTVSYKVYDAFGENLTGNGAWGRRLKMDKTEFWLCTDAVTGFPNAKGTLPKANQVVTQDMKVDEINKLGVFSLNLFDFHSGEVLEVVSVKYNGEEILKK